MFGTYRLLFALLVLVTHIGRIEVVAGLAVWAFFMLSGFLITGVLNTRYGYSGKGMLEFALSRALRLFPTYWLSVAMGLLLVQLLSHVFAAGRVNSALAVPLTAREWIAAFTMLGHSMLGLGRIDISPSPSAWAVEVEICMYAASAWWLSQKAQSARNTAVLLTILFPILWAIGRWVRPTSVDIAGQLTYSFLPAALLPYAIGTLIWHKRPALWVLRPTVPRLVLAAVLLATCGLGLSRISVTATYVASLPILAFLTVALSNTEKSAGTAAKIDDFLGHMSYPVYLLHWSCAYLTAAFATHWSISGIFRLGADGMVHFTTAGFFVVVLVVLTVSAATAGLLEVPMERHRRSIAARWANCMVRRPTPRDA
jgi:peptidoglycan/LPS O-acetylase OafA/YrhL